MVGGMNFLTSVEVTRIICIITPQFKCCTTLTKSHDICSPCTEFCLVFPRKRHFFSIANLSWNVLSRASSRSLPIYLRGPHQSYEMSAFLDAEASTNASVFDFECFFNPF
ncbi:UNVERIFIED_CONTAM: hypothetical protein NCL1_40200 [Trichonephila clavipes]